MSYILDALRKADAERERGSVPGLHAQSPPPGADDAAPGRPVPPWMWAAGGGLLVVLAVTAWQLMAPVPPTPTVVAAATPAASAAAPLASPVLMPAPVPAQAPAPAPRPTQLEPQPRPQRQPQPPQRARQPKPQPEPPRQPQAPTQQVDGKPSAEGRIHALGELPADIRRELPVLSIGGSIYSNDAASRFLIINGQVFHENDEVLPNLTLEQIKLKAAVLRFKGYRYTVAF